MKTFFLIAMALAPSVWAETTIPFEREIPRVNEYRFVTSRAQDSEHFRTSFGGDDQGDLYFKGYSLLNIGPNDIVPTMPDSVDYPNREYFFITDDHAKRDTYLWVTDYVGSGATSDYFESIFMFLPRVSQQGMEEVGEEIHANLATGEEIVFFKKYKTLLRGVLSEKALDYNPDRTQRKFADIQYNGRGIVLRSNAKGRDPRLAKEVLVMKRGLKDCSLPGHLFWTQGDYPKFKFVNDEDAYAVIEAKCGAAYLPEM